MRPAAELTNPPSRRELIAAATFADNAFSAELERVFGRHAGDARYDDRGESTPELVRLSAAALDAKRAAGLI